MTRHLVLLLTAVSGLVLGGEVAVQKEPLHLRATDEREWDHLPAKADRSFFSKTFDLDAEFGSFQSLTWEQSQVQQRWEVTLNGKRIGWLAKDYQLTAAALAIPPKLLREKGNQLEIRVKSDKADDIFLEKIALSTATVDELALGGTVTVQVTGENGEGLPSRITIIDQATGSFPHTGAKSSDRLAVRNGVIYTLDGKAKFTLPPGAYQIYASRGFEYSFHRAVVTVERESQTSLDITLVREVETTGLVSCDPHLHTGEFARHGDASLIERLITIAGENIELPVSTEHDQHIDFLPEASRIGADRWFTTLLGCEVSTAEGHFGSFPIVSGSPTVQHKLRPWDKVFESIFATPGVQICVLNHGRDFHKGFSPLDEETRWDPKTGNFTDGRNLRANAIEVINSGAQRCDPMELVKDWMALRKNGHQIAAIGSSDSHTVRLSIPGQARTYLPVSNDEDPAKIDLAEAMNSVLKNDTRVCFGLLAELVLTEKNGISVSVRGPSWTTMTKLLIFLDGELVEEKTFNLPAGKTDYQTVLDPTSWKIERANTAVGEVVAVALGPGPELCFWRHKPPWQRSSGSYQPYVMGISQPLRRP